MRGQLVRLQSERGAIEAAGGQLLALSVDPPEDVTGMLERLATQGTPLDFPLVSDPDRAICKRYGVFDSAHDMALPAVVILDRDLKVAWSYAGGSIFDRPPEHDLLAQLKRLTQ